ncbi:hypothetical protein JX265_002214 [Neoarthrinium moseri]|uniref:FAD/NAD(P)-binding domain-containing protein n=1 Tax=Neoarthrinium moseri TaxID=1658444 RepID=A0A9P9WU77_9PEZI|nr:hypothetical protein JX265_002214 [Neoarthrinium moseri]
MIFFRAVQLISLPLCIRAAIIPPQGSILSRQFNGYAEGQYDLLHDAIVIGGGPAGLSALSGLARVRRKAILIDSGEYRNGPTRHMHDVVGFDGVEPAYFRWAARRLLSYYETIQMVNGTVTKIEPAQNNIFLVTGSYPTEVFPYVEEVTLRARKVVLATGLRDILPETPGIAQNWGEGIYWCPWCDGHEHEDQALGLLGSLDDIPGLVREILTLNTDIVAFTNGTNNPTTRAAADKSFPDWERFLSIHNVTIDDRTITSVERLKDGSPDSDPSLPSQPQYDLFRVNFDQGEAVERAAFFASFQEEQRSTIGQEVGVNLYGGRLAANQSSGLQTNIPGIYAIGDANSDNVTNVPHAMFSGKRTAVYLHVSLAREDASKELSVASASDGTVESARDMHFDPRAVWDVMDRGPRDMFYAGEFDQ